MKGKFVSNCLEENIEDIKFAALYYDNIEILKNIVHTVTKPDDEGVTTVRGVYNCLDEVFVSHIKMLEEEGIVSYEESNDVRFVPLDNEEDWKVDKFDLDMWGKSQQLMQEVGNKLFQLDRNGEWGYCRFLSPEVENIHSYFINPIKVGAKIDLEFIYTYYSNLIFYILKNIKNGGNVITSSGTVDSYFKDYFINKLNNSDNTNLLGKSNIGIATIKHIVPNVSKLSFEEILELRYKCRNELGEYRNYMEELNKNITKDKEFKSVKENTELFIVQKIQPSIRELEKKITKSKINVNKLFIDEVKDINSYIPLLGSIFVNLPVQIAMLLSMGIISTKVALQWKENNIDIKDNGLYYLFKLRDNII